MTLFTGQIKRFRAQKGIAQLRLSLYFLFVLLVLVIVGHNPTPLYAQNEVYLSIQAGGTGKIGIGIGGFEAGRDSTGIIIGDSAFIFAVRSTLISDFNNSGLFTVKALPDSLTSLSGGMFAQWRATGARYFVYGNASEDGSRVAVDVVDLESSLSVLHEEYQILNDRPWYTAHVIVDDLIQELTGLRGSMASQIAYVSPYRKETNELFVMNADGRGKHQLTYTRTLNMSPSWSPDGESLAFSSLVDGIWTIQTVNVNTGQTTSVASEGGLNSAPSYSPVQENILAFTSDRDGNSELYTCSADGRNIRRLTNHRSIDSSPSWSPEGDRIAFTSDRISQPMVYLMNRDGSGIRRLTSRINAYEDSPCWSPRGDRLVFVVLFDRSFDIATCSPSGDDTIILTAGQGSNENPRWSPDGLRILFTSTRDGGKNLYIMDADGSNVRRITDDNSSYSPAWAPSSPGNDIRITSRR